MVPASIFMFVEKTLERDARVAFSVLLSMRYVLSTLNFLQHSQGS
jgi:hypothetical protein